jgi:hypothetical protein
MKNWITAKNMIWKDKFKVFFIFLPIRFAAVLRSQICQSAAPDPRDQQGAAAPQDFHDTVTTLFGERNVVLS